MKCSLSVKKHNCRKWQVGLWNAASEFNRSSQLWTYTHRINNSVGVILVDRSHSSEVYKTTFCPIRKEKDKPRYRRNTPQLWLSKQQKETERSKVKPVGPEEAEPEPCWKFQNKRSSWWWNSCWSNGEVWKLTALTGMESNLTAPWFQVHKNILKFLECGRRLNMFWENKFSMETRNLLYKQHRLQQTNLWEIWPKCCYGFGGG